MTLREGAGLGSIPTQWDEEYELVVLGAGAGGMTAALVASIEGLRDPLNREERSGRRDDGVFFGDGVDSGQCAAAPARGHERCRSGARVPGCTGGRPRQPRTPRGLHRRGARDAGLSGATHGCRIPSLSPAAGLSAGLAGGDIGGAAAGAPPV